jgi:hypothetical protein
LAELNAEPVFDVANYFVAAHRLTCLGAAYFERVPAGRRVAEIVVEADCAVNFRLGNIQGVCNQGDCRIIDVAELLL